MLRWTLAALAVLATTNAAAAAERTQVVTAYVWHADLDLTTEEGAGIMLRRLAISAREICAQVESPIWPRAQGHAWRCRRRLIKQGLEKLDAWQVRQAYSRALARGGLAELVR